jgi:predicted dehydrogenase
MKPGSRRGNMRVAVVGAGQMGMNHMRVYDMVAGVELVAVVDSDFSRAQEAAKRYDCLAFESPDSLIGLVDAASVTVPTVAHETIGVTLLESGIHCLIEKPLAGTEDECIALIEASRRNGVVLLVGLVEHFNPAVQQLLGLLNEGVRMYAVDVRRMSPVSARVTDVDVVTDLMVHDLDIVLTLMNSPVTDVSAHGVRTTIAGSNDYVTALLSFENGGLASLTASRITQNKVRDLQVSCSLGTIWLNYSTQELLIFREAGGSVLYESPSEPGNFTLDLATERVLVRTTEPLIAELRHFIDAVVNGVPVEVGGERALEAQRLMWRVHEKTTGSLVHP